MRFYGILMGLVCCALSVRAQIDCIWLSHKSNDLGKVVISWESGKPGNSVVEFGATKELGQKVTIDESVLLHHVEILVPARGTAYFYKVSSGSESSAVHSFRTLPVEKLRVALVANWQEHKNLDCLLKDDIHLLLTGGDNIDCLHKKCGAGVKDCIKPYSDLIRAYPKLFSSVLFLPALGNHDKEITPRGPKPPAEPVYDIDATAYRTFFELPGDEWKWNLDIPEFDLRLIALDIQHTSDMGTTWQTCHPYKKGTPQYEWYAKLLENPKPRFVVTIQNEKSGSIRSQDTPPLHTLFSKGTIAITGFGYFAERADVDGFSYYNTSLGGKGAKYKDPKAAFFESEDSYILMSLEAKAATMRVEIKDLSGKVLHAMDEPHK
ncbi:MAG TPA: fibronectin type III domain-containing protein [Planctomycetota bacterium]|nr:fibronectin type III domain-containing protein [Planctomycetota bacterium]